MVPFRDHDGDSWLNFRLVISQLTEDESKDCSKATVKQGVVLKLNAHVQDSARCSSHSWKKFQIDVEFVDSLTEPE